MTVQLPDRTQARNMLLTVPPRSAKGRRPALVEPRSVSHRMLRQIGMLKISFFSGAFGIRFSKLLDAAVESLKAQGCDRLVIDLRGCLGGSLGFARLVSYLCPDRIPVGSDVTRRRQQRGYKVAQLPRVLMPSGNFGLLFCFARFSLRDKSLVLLTQGLGRQPFHGRVVVLVNEWTNSDRGNGCSVCEGQVEATPKVQVYDRTFQSTLIRTDSLTEMTPRSTRR
jgi:C-terminal processing protease CtpA/Prc